MLVGLRLRLRLRLADRGARVFKGARGGLVGREACGDGAGGLSYMLNKMVWLVYSAFTKGKQIMTHCRRK